MRAARVAWHVLRGLALVTYRFQACDQVERGRLARQWSAQLLAIIAIRIEVSGSLAATGSRPLMLVANHVSWLDVYALNAHCPACFVAKSEIAHWPLLGPLARSSGTVFIERARRRDILRVNQLLVQRMRAGVPIAVFPEGTTSAGDAVLPFRPALLQAAIDCRAQVQPVAIRYERIDGSLCAEAAFTGDTSFAAALWRVLRQPGFRVRLHFLPAALPACTQRKPLARDAQHRIAQTLAWRAASALAPASPAPVAGLHKTQESSPLPL